MVKYVRIDFDYKSLLFGNPRFRHETLHYSDTSSTQYIESDFIPKLRNIGLYSLPILWYGFWGLLRAYPAHITTS